MKSITPRILVVLATLAFFSSLLMPGDAASCDDVPTTTWSEACLKISLTPAMYNLCQETLQHTPESAKITVYGIEAAEVAWQSYAATEDEAGHRIMYGPLTGDEQAAYERCLTVYATARISMEAAMENMKVCEFKKSLQEYIDAENAIESCSYELSGLQQPSSLVAMNAADRDNTRLAIDLSALSFGHGGN